MVGTSGSYQIAAQTQLLLVTTARVLQFAASSLGTRLFHGESEFCNLQSFAIGRVKVAAKNQGFTGKK